MNIYDSIIEGVQCLPATTRGQVYTAIIEYLYFGREPDFKMSDAAQALFISFKPNLDVQIAKQRAGAAGGRAQTNRQANVKQTSSKSEAEGQAYAKQNASEQEQEQDKEKDGANAPSKERARFKPPTPEEVEAYLAEKGWTGMFSGEEFCAFYASKGWMVGRNKMKDWKAACVTWMRGRKNPQVKGGDYIADYD